MRMVSRVIHHRPRRIYKTMDEPDKAAKEYDKAIRQMRADQGSIRQVANAFIQANETDRALEAYEREAERCFPKAPASRNDNREDYGTKGDNAPDGERVHGPTRGERGIHPSGAECPVPLHRLQHRR